MGAVHLQGLTTLLKLRYAIRTFVVKRENHMTVRLTRRSDQLLKSLHNFIEEHHYAPSVRELKARLGWNSESTVQHWLYWGQENGLLEGVGDARTLRLTDAGREALR